MTQRATGTVTLLFTDLVGSTELRQRLGDDEADRQRREHFQSLRRAVSSHGGREIKTLGDGLMAEFPSALDAAACAVAIQRAVHQQNAKQKERELQVRVGLDAGEPLREEGDLFGTPVVVAKRLCDSAEGGQIIVSELVRGLIGSRGGHTFRPLEPALLKGITEPVAANELVWAPEAGRGAADFAEAGTPPLPPALAATDRTAFVGRAAELELLRSHLAATQTGAQRLVLLAGEAGIGKTRLAIELARIARDEGATVLYGRCEEHAPLAYGAFAQALREPAATRRVPEDVFELTRGIEPSRADERRYQLFESVAVALREMAHERPLVLVLDDLHWADTPTLALLRHLARSDVGATLIVGSYRETDLTREHPLARALADLQRERLLERIDVGALQPTDVGAMVGAWAGLEAAPELARAIHEHTEGNPFFIEELLRHLSETGALRQEDGRLVAGLSAARLAVPEGVKAIIGQRLERLSEQCNSVLTVASVIGREFDIDSLQRASDLGTEPLLAALDEAVAARVIEEVWGPGRYEFAHALIHETLYEELTTTRRVHLHGQTLRYADSNGVKLAYEVLGSTGPFLVAVGVSNCPAVRGRNWTTTRRWEPIARYCRLVLYDRRGVGYSAAPERGYSLLAGIEDLRAVLDAAGAERVFVWGATDGGPMAIGFAAQYPERTAGLVLLGTTAKYTNAEDFSFGVNPALLESFLRTEAVDQGQAASEVTRARQPEGAEAIAEVARRVPRRAWSKLIGGVGAGDARSLLSAVRAPTLIIHDPGNTYIPVDAAHFLHEHIANSELEITEEVASSLFGERLYHRVREFIDRAGAGSAE